MSDGLNGHDFQLTVSWATETYPVTLNASESCKVDKDMSVRRRGDSKSAQSFTRNQWQLSLADWWLHSGQGRNKAGVREYSFEFEARQVQNLERKRSKDKTSLWDLRCNLRFDMEELSGSQVGIATVCASLCMLQVDVDSDTSVYQGTCGTTISRVSFWPCKPYLLRQFMMLTRPNYGPLLVHEYPVQLTTHHPAKSEPGT